MFVNRVGEANLWFAWEDLSLFMSPENPAANFDRESPLD